MAATATMVERLTGIVPEAYRHEVVRLGRKVRDSLPPVAIMRRIDAIERHFDRRLTQVEAKLDEVLRRGTTKA
jgi:hypothetical protein